MCCRGLSGSVGITKPDSGVSVGFVGVPYREPDTDAGRCRHGQNDGRRSNMVKAIETLYRGYRFRSRLEARWAVFMDAAGIQWEYEPEGFDLGERGWYLPDFFCKHNGHRGPYVEIKPIKPTQEEIEKLIAVCDENEAYGVFIWGSPGKHEAFEIHKDGFVYGEMEFDEIIDRLSSGSLNANLKACISAARAARFEHGEHP